MARRWSRNLGHPCSYGCIRMRSCDVVSVYEKVMIGTHVMISEKPLKVLIRDESPNTLDVPSA